MRALGAVEEVFLLALFALGGAGVEVWVGDLGGSAVGTDVDGVVPCDYGGEGGGCEDVAGRKGMLVSRRKRMIERAGLIG